MARDHMGPMPPPLSSFVKKQKDTTDNIAFPHTTYARGNNVSREKLISSVVPEIEYSFLVSYEPPVLCCIIVSWNWITNPKQ